MNEEYMPSQQDMLKARVRTTGLITHKYEVREYKFSVIDVGGERNERLYIL